MGEAVQNQGTQLDGRTVGVDFNKVDKVEAHHRLLGENIIRFQASPTEVMDWYTGHDPLDERDGLIILNIGDLPRNREIAALLLTGPMIARYRKDIEILDHGAAILVAHAYIPEAFRGDSANGMKNAEAVLNRHLSVDQVPAPVTPQNIIYSCLQRYPNHPFSLEQLRYLFCAGEIIEQSLKYRFIFYQGDKKTDISENHYLSKQLFQLVSSKALGGNQDIDTRTLGLDALWINSGNNLFEQLGNSPDKKAQRETQLLAMINALEDVFIKKDKILHSGGQNQVRGQLHELVWYLDALMLLESRNNTSTKVFPSNTYQDRPIINHPDLNRAFDFRVSYPNGSALVQLKSRPQPRSNKPYHPLVVPVHEQNFLDINPSRLHNKLQKYREIVANHFENSSADLKKYVLPSVYNVLDNPAYRKDTLEVVKSLYEGGNKPVPRLLNRHDRRIIQALTRNKKR